MLNPVEVASHVVPFQGFARGGQPARGYVPVRYGASLYMLCQRTAFPYRIQALKSEDAGITWSELDAAHAPVKSDAITAGQWITAHSIMVAYQPNAYDVEGPLTFADFDFDTGLWSVPYSDAPAPNVYGVNQLFWRDDSLVVICNRANTGANLIGLTAHVWDGDSWVSIDLDTGLPGGGYSNSGCAAVMDENKNIHIFSIVWTGMTRSAMYVCLTAANAVTNLRTFTDAQFNSGQWSMQKPALVNDSIVLGVVMPDDSGVGLLVGSPIAAPVFHVTPAIDNGATIKLGGACAPDLSFDGTTLYSVWGNASLVRVIRTSPDLLQSYAETVYDKSLHVDVHNVSYPGIEATEAGIEVALQVNRTGTDYNALFAGDYIPPAPVAPVFKTSFTFAIIDVRNLWPISLPDPKFTCEDDSENAND